MTTIPNAPVMGGSSSAYPPNSSFGGTRDRVSHKRLIECLHACQVKGYTYGLGAKMEDIKNSQPTNPNHRVDCSGFHRWVIYQLTGVEIPDGSVNQNDWYASKGFRHRQIGPYSINIQNGTLYACFCRAGSRGETIGHVWLALDGHTYESHGGVGPNSRPTDLPLLEHICTDFYPIAQVDYTS